MKYITKSLIGEALVGSGPEVAHIDLVVGSKGGAVETAFMISFATPRTGHTPLLAILEPNLPIKPTTLIINKVTIKNSSQATLMFGPAQAAVAKAIIDSVEERIIDKDEVENILIIVSIFVEWDAQDKDKIYKHNYDATKLALSRAIKKEPSIDDLLARKDRARHPFA